MKRFFAGKKKLIIIGLLILGLVVYLLFSRAYIPSAPVIKSIFPTNGETRVPLNSPVDIVFVANVREKDKLFVRFVPVVEFGKKWLTDSSLRLVPKQLLLEGTEYKVDISYDDGFLIASSFTTRSVNKPDEEDYVEDVTELLIEESIAVGRDIERIKEKMPWYFSLPLVDDEYVVVHNEEKGMFRISMYVPGNTSEEYKNDLIREALARLELVGVDMSRYEYYVIYR